MQNGHDSNPVDETIYCSLPRRLLAMLYDSIILLGVLIIASAIALPFGKPQKVAFEDLWFTLWLVVVCFAYFGACWRYARMTLGMRAWHIRIVSDTGKPVSWPRCLLRFLVGAISLAALGLGVLWALIDRKNRGWHDLAARTLLVRLSGAKR
ncbi:MAG: RDD family protein [Xanthomonadales bacterium]|nr:RDD family protein [Xanthomonadales bacterium]